VTGIDPKQALSNRNAGTGIKSLDWKKWAAIPEVFGTVAVVVSLVFVGISIRQNTAVAQANQQNLLYELTDTWFSDQVNHPHLYEIESKSGIRSP